MDIKYEYIAIWPLEKDVSIMSIVSVIRTEIPDVLNNPNMGWVPWADYGPYPQPHRLVYGGITWRELEPQKGSFAWNTIENRLKFSYWSERKVKFVIRLILDLPGNSSSLDIPDWLYQEINREGTWYSSGFSPNYKNSALISNHLRMIRAFGQRYNNDSRIAFIQLGSLGHWGEFHTMYLNPTDQGYLPSINISDQYVGHYLSSLTNKKLLMRRPFQIAKDNNTGLYNDVFGNAVETQRFIRYFNSGYSNTGNWGFAAGTYPAMPDFWKYSPSGGEFDNLSYLNNSSIQQTIQLAVDSHTSFLGPNCPAGQALGSPLQTNINALHNRMGYRFVLQLTTYESQVEAGDSASILMTWNNKGISPFYFKWPLELSLADSNGNIAFSSNTDEDIRTWLPGVKTVTQQLNIPDNLAGGTYTLCVAIIDPETNTPGIDLAITGRRSDGRYSLGQIFIAGSDPIISSIKASAITDTGAAISWSTDKPSDSQVEYGLTSYLGSITPIYPALITAHGVTLSGLKPSSTYYYRVKSKGEHGNTAVSDLNTFSTFAEPEFIIDGDTSDWDDIDIIAKPSIIRGMKVSNDGFQLYICIEGTGLLTKSSIYINTGKNNTGYNVPGWSFSRCDYLLENDFLLKYSGSGSDWSWSSAGIIEFAKNNSVVEAALPLNTLQLSPGSVIYIGYVMNDSQYLRLPNLEQPLISYIVE